MSYQIVHEAASSRSFRKTTLPKSAVLRTSIAYASPRALQAIHLEKVLLCALSSSRLSTSTTASGSNTTITTATGDKAIDSVGSTPDMAAIAAREFAHEEQPRTLSPPRAPLTLVTPAQTAEGGWQQWTRNTPPPNIGLALGPEVAGSSRDGPSPITPGSNRTHSQLLPEKPTYSLFPPPLRTGPNSRRTSQTLRPPASNAYAPDKSSPMAGPSFPSSMDTSQAHLQGVSRNRSLSDPFYDPPKGSPLQGYRGIPWTDLSTTVRKPLPAQPSSRVRGIRTSSTSQAQQPNLPRPYPPPPPIEQHYMAAINRQHSRRNTARKKSNSSSQFTRFSNGSETSFEDADDDLLPQPKTTLSPVAEVRSPPQRPPKVMYPPVPTTAAESSTRVINRPRPPHQSDSLLAKRRGDEKAAELAAGMSSNGARRSRSSIGRTPPMRGYVHLK
ncbi:MAG: hypothetical protein Q9164_005478 [Protoblastenia rupestris]